MVTESWRWQVSRTPSTCQKCEQDDNHRGWGRTPRRQFAGRLTNQCPKMDSCYNTLYDSWFAQTQPKTNTFDVTQQLSDWTLTLSGTTKEQAVHFSCPTIFTVVLGYLPSRVKCSHICALSILRCCLDDSSFRAG